MEQHVHVCADALTECYGRMTCDCETFWIDLDLLTPCDLEVSVDPRTSCWLVWAGLRTCDWAVGRSDLTTWLPEK